MMPADALSNLGLAQATVSTLGTVMIIGLGFLHHPSRAALLWSLAFVLAMTSTWISVAGATIGDEEIRRAGLGLMLGAPALIWSGFRARRGVRALPWIGAGQAVATAAAFVLASDLAVYGVTFRVAFLGAAVFAALTIVELRQAADRLERLVLPLMIVSAGFVVLGVGIVVAGIALPSNIEDLQMPRLLNGLAMLVYIVCATVSLLYFTSVFPERSRSATSWPQFSVTASDRLARARRARETAWAVLSVRLDDPQYLRSAAGESSWAQIVASFEAVVSDTFPADADIGRDARGRVVVLIAGPGPVLRERIRTVLRRITEMHTAPWIDVQLSASVGWVPAEAGEYDLATLVAQADAAASGATRLGGDRWERVRL